ncbi:hypothetical protein KIF59_21810 [Enterobacter cloacae subsp. cloacae]|nr:hypothetical protein [Enterobacter cloacae subsp. cloacae]
MQNYAVDWRDESIIDFEGASYYSRHAGFRGAFAKFWLPAQLHGDLRLNPLLRMPCAK